jgi:Phosphotransferase enzyme family
MSFTPPHLPTYNVRLGTERITTIVSAVFQTHNVTNVKQLESGKSYNNRIYFIDIHPIKRLNTSADETSQSLVLKIAGHFFDHRKIENELGCLYLFKKFCPDLPVPVPYAWSKTGQEIQTVDGRTICSQPGSQPFSDHAWILTSRLPGRVLTVADMDGPDGETLLRQLGRYATMWRTQIPPTRLWGNLRFQSDTTESSNTATPTATSPQKVLLKDAFPNQTLELSAFLLNSYPWPNTAQWYPTLAQDQLSRIYKQPHFRQTFDSHAAKWKKWADEDLPTYPHSQPEEYVLTHFDFSPRNVLVGRDEEGKGPLRITAVLDFEFTGFMPAEEEFLNAMIRRGGDFEERHFDVILHEMALLGQRVPPTKGVRKIIADGKTKSAIQSGGGVGSGKEGGKEIQFLDERYWKQACILAKTIDRIAPWEVMDGKFEPEELKRELDEAAATVEEGLRKLVAFKEK